MFLPIRGKQSRFIERLIKHVEPAPQAHQLSTKSILGAKDNVLNKAPLENLTSTKVSMMLDGFAIKDRSISTSPTSKITPLLQVHDAHCATKMPNHKFSLCLEQEPGGPVPILTKNLTKAQQQGTGKENDIERIHGAPAMPRSSHLV
jgi:hypothetical protein